MSSRIIKVVGMTNHDTYAIVHVVMEDGLECQIFIGGDCDVFYHHEVAKAHVKRNKTTKAIDFTE